MSRPTYLALIFVSLLLTPLLSPAQPGEKAPPPDFLWPGVVTGNALDPMPAFAHRMGWWREKSLREAGGATSSEAAVVRGLQWLIKQQLDGHWTLTDTSEANPIAATSLALLPFLAAGKTHKPHPSNPYSDEIAKGLQFLIKSQDPKTGFFGGDAHALATITICEAYGLSRDPDLKKPAERAVLYIVTSQHEASGGWGYQPGGRRDLLVTGWQIAALKTAHDAGIAIPLKTMDRAQAFVSNCGTMDGGFGPGPGSKSTPHMTAVGLLAAIHLGLVAPNSPQLRKGVDNVIKKHPPKEDETHYRFHATQVMITLGGRDWRQWNEECRDHFVKTQVTDRGGAEGSWSPAKNSVEMGSGRLTITSLNLLTLEVYYRNALLPRRDKAKNGP